MQSTVVINSNCNTKEALEVAALPAFISQLDCISSLKGKQRITVGGERYFLSGKCVFSLFLRVKVRFYQLASFRRSY